MTTRTELFKLWSDEKGYGFFLGHNKMRHENSVNMLAKVVEASAILEKKELPSYSKQDLPYSGKITSGMLAMQPNELFPYLFQRSSAILQINVSNRGTIYLLPDEQIKEKVLENKKENKLEYLLKILKEVFKGALTYTLHPDSTRKVNIDIVDQSKVYVKINENAMLQLSLNLNLKDNLLDAAAYRIWDEVEIDKKEGFQFYFKEKKKTKKIEIKKITTTKYNGKEKLYEKENKLTKWICLRMAKSLNAYDTWLQLLETNKKKAKQRNYDAEKVEYLESILSWSLNSYVMLQNKQEKIPKLSYVDLQYADRELKKL